MAADQTFSLIAPCLLGALLLAAPICDAEPSSLASPPVADLPPADSKDPVADHLALGQAYLDRGESAKAVLEFEQVRRFDNLPPDLRQQAEIYAKAARNYREGKRLSGFGFAETGGGYYRENGTRTTNASGGNPARDWFWEARIGGGLGYLLGNNLSIALLFWGCLFGTVGMFLAVPLTTALIIALDASPHTRPLAILMGPEIDASSAPALTAGTLEDRADDTGAGG